MQKNPKLPDLMDRNFQNIRANFLNKLKFLFLEF